MEHSDWRLNGKRMSFLGWVSVLAVIAVCMALFHQATMRNWRKNGLPSWMVAYERWEKRKIYEWRISHRSRPDATTGIHSR